MGTGASGNFNNRAAISSARIYGGICAGRNQQCPDVLRLFNWQRVITELDTGKRAGHLSLHGN
jgi:hypothetical protein